MTVDLPADTISFLRVTPWNPQLTTVGGQTQLTVMGMHADSIGSTDITSSCSFWSHDTSIANVSDLGLVTAVANGVVRLNLAYLDLFATAPVSVLVTGAPDATASSGWVHGSAKDADGNPLDGVTVSMDGVTGVVETDANGRFAFPTPEGTRVFHLTAEKAGYTYAMRNGSVTAGHDASLEPIVLVTLDAAETSVGPAGGTHASSTGDVEISVPAGAVTDTISLRVTNLQAHDQIPQLPDESDFTYCIKLEPDLQVFEKAVTIRLANTLGFDAASLVPLGRFTRDTGQWEALTMGTVTGGVGGNQWVEFETLGFSWCDANARMLIQDRLNSINSQMSLLESTDKSPRMNDGPTMSCAGVAGSSLIAQEDGNLLEKHRLPTYRSLGARKSVQLVYNSRTAAPMVPLSMDYVGMADPPGRLEKIRVTFEIEGLFNSWYHQATALDSRFSYMWDGTNARGQALPTGLYTYRETLTHLINGSYFWQEYFGGPVTIPTWILARQPSAKKRTYTGLVSMVRFTDSPFGAGWGVEGLQQLILDTYQPLIVDGNGEAVAFRKTATEENITLSLPAGILLNDAPCHVTSDGNGGFYFLENDALQLFHADRTGQVRRLVGSSDWPESAKRDPRAGVSTCGKLTLDSMGNVYICQAGEGLIQRFDTNGTLVRVAGGGSGGDGSRATDAQLDSPLSSCVDSNGNLYIVEPGNNRIRIVGPDGIIQTYAGTGESGFEGDGGPAILAKLNDPKDVALDGEGNLYIADRENRRIRKINRQGIITTIAGNGLDSSGEPLRGPAIQAPIGLVTNLAFNPQGNLVFRSDLTFGDPMLYEIDATQQITGLITLAEATGGSIGTGFSIDSAGRVLLGITTWVGPSDTEP